MTASNSQNFSISNKTKGKLPRLPFVRIKESVLGTKYDLSLVFVGDKESKELNIKHRGKSYIPDVLSFELDSNTGEMFINLKECKRQAPLFKLSYENFVVFIFIHGLCHLKGMEHGSTMERTETRFRKLFGI